MEFPTLFDEIELEPAPPEPKPVSSPAPQPAGSPLSFGEFVLALDEEQTAQAEPLADEEEDETGWLVEFDPKLAARLLRENAIADTASLAGALDELSRRPIFKLGEQLASEGFISQQQLREALAQQKNTGKRKIGDILVEMGMVSRDVIEIALFKRLGIPLVNLHKLPIDNEAMLSVPQILAQKFSLMPCMYHRGNLVVAMENPQDQDALKELYFKTGRNITPTLAEREDIDWAIRQHYIKKRRENPWVFKV